MHLLPIVSGFIASTIHVVSGPDHLAAVTPLVTETDKKAWKIGAAWGSGHVSGMLLIGILFLFFKDRIPLELISGFNERMVALILIAIGLWTFYRIYTHPKKHAHPHVHKINDKTFVHIHRHEHYTETHEHTHETVNGQGLLPALGIGVIHGFAGVSHFILFFPVLGFKTVAESGLYIAGFAAGTIIAMTAYAFTLGLIKNLSAREKSIALLKGIRIAGGTFAVGIGVYWLFQSF
jgi:ABC-type nickel/cobalt efflux system permease component RcnA